MTPRVVLTRPFERQVTLSQSLLDAGYEVLSLPALSIQPSTTVQWPLPQDFDWVVFVSRAAWQHFWGAIEAQQPGYVWPSKCRIAAVGSVTADYIRQTLVGRTDRAVNVISPPSTLPQDSESLWQCLSPELKSSNKVLIVRGQSGREWLSEKLRSRDCLVDVLEAYRRSPVSWTAPSIATLQQWGKEGRLGVWLVTSQQGLSAIQAQWSAHQLDPWRPEGAVVIHPRLKAPVQAWLGKGPVLVTQANDKAIIEVITGGFTSGPFRPFS